MLTPLLRTPIVVPELRSSSPPLQPWGEILSAPLTPTTVDRNIARQECSRNLLSRFGLDVRAHDRASRSVSSSHPENVQRVQRAPRVKMHRSCHRCGSNFGANVYCTRCNHRRCNDCPRAPAAGVQKIMQQAQEAFTAEEERKEAAKRVEPEQKLGVAAATEVSEESAPPVSIIPDLDLDLDFDLGAAMLARIARSRQSVHLLARGLEQQGHSPATFDPHRQTHYAGVQRVYRKPRQRVRYVCDKCHKTCDKHSRKCANCPQDISTHCQRIP